MLKPKSIHNSSFLYVAQEEKRNMWIYYEKNAQSVFLIDPITPNSEVISFLNDMQASNKYIVMTACQVEKKNNANLWIKIFDDFEIITPDKTYLPRERILSPNEIISFQQQQTIYFLSIIIGGSHRLCLKINQYLFIGEIIYSIFKAFNSLEELFKYNSTIKSFFSTLDENTLVLHSFGPISLLSDMSIYQHNRLKKDFYSFW